MPYLQRNAGDARIESLEKADPIPRRIYQKGGWASRVPGLQTLIQFFPPSPQMQPRGKVLVQPVRQFRNLRGCLREPILNGRTHAAGRQSALGSRIPPNVV